MGIAVLFVRARFEVGKNRLSRVTKGNLELEQWRIPREKGDRNVLDNVQY